MSASIKDVSAVCWDYLHRMKLNRNEWTSEAKQTSRRRTQIHFVAAIASKLLTQRAHFVKRLTVAAKTNAIRVRKWITVKHFDIISECWMYGGFAKTIMIGKIFWIVLHKRIETRGTVK
jgi:hypothetical protein